MTDQYEPLRELFRAKQIYGPQAARCMQCSIATATKRLRNPGQMTLDELTSLCLRGGIPADEIRERIKFGGSRW